jgi:signal transduction histidine kinase/CheY-like chemotaxis protein
MDCFSRGGRLAHSFWLSTGLVIVALIAGGGVALRDITLHAQRSEIALTFSHLAEGMARLELSVIHAIEEGSTEDRQRIRANWRDVLYHLLVLQETEPADSESDEARALHESAAQLAARRMADWHPVHHHDLRGLTMPPALAALWKHDRGNTFMEEVVAETVMTLEAIVGGSGPITPHERHALLVLRQDPRRAQTIDLLREGSILLAIRNAKAPDTSRTMVVALVSAGTLAALGALFGVLLPLARRVERDRAALNRALEAATAASKAKTEFLSTVSHELRTPLNGVLGMTALMEQTEMTPRQHVCLEAVRAGALAVTSVIDDMLEYSRLDRGTLRLERAAFDLADLGRDPAQKLAAAASLQGMELLFRIDPAAPRALVGDLARLNHIISNMLSNALKFARKGDVLVQIATEPLTAGAVLLKVSVTDEGPGIAAGMAERIFECFVQDDQSATRGRGGVGLGLAICHTLIGMMGGHIGVHNNPAGRGAEFWFAVSLSIACSEPIYTPQPALSGRRIAVICARRLRCGSLEDALRGWGAEPIMAPDTGTLWADPTAKPPDAIIIDHLPPGHDAMEALEQLADLWPRTGVIVMSGTDGAFDHPRCTVLRKPVAPPVMLETLRITVGRQEAERLLAEASETEPGAEQARA